MFTGIVQTKLPISDIKTTHGIAQLTLAFPDEFIIGLKIGASVAINGTCLTVVSLEANNVSFDIVAGTLAQTNLGDLQRHDSVNVERSLKFGDEIGGHILSGHIHSTAKIEAILREQANTRMVIGYQAACNAYIFDKGFIGVNGASLTIASVDHDQYCFALNLIPETLAKTTLGEAKVGDRVNIELDSQTVAIVDTVERVLAQREMAD